MFRGSVRRTGVAAVVVPIVLALAAAPAVAAGGRSAERELEGAAEGAFEALEAADQYAEARTAPADTVDARRFLAAATRRLRCPLRAGLERAHHRSRYDSDAPGYRDPVWSNSGGGARLVGGRMTALAADGGTLYARCGGRWRMEEDRQRRVEAADRRRARRSRSARSRSTRTTGCGSAPARPTRTRTPTPASASCARPTAARPSTGRRRRAQQPPDRRGSPSTARASSTPRRATGSSGTRSSDLRLDAVLAAGIGLPRDLLAVGGAPARPSSATSRSSRARNGHIVAGRRRLARRARTATASIESNDCGQTFSTVTVNGAINDDRPRPDDVRLLGRRLEALRDRPVGVDVQPRQDGRRAARSCRASTCRRPAAPRGPWNKIAEWRKLADSGSALKRRARATTPASRPGTTSSSPSTRANPNHVYLGLEEVFETNDGGASWKTDRPVLELRPAVLRRTTSTAARPRPIPDQHAVAIAGGTVYVGNDGGVYSRAA